MTNTKEENKRILNIETSGEFLRRLGTDGDLWAKEFMKIWGNRLKEIDVDLMRGWFCNAIEVRRNLE